MIAEKKSILIVDDDKRILYAFKKALEKTNYNLLFADSGDAAFAILQSESIDLAIVDLRMPIISGYEILEKLKKDYPSIFRIALIGYVDESKILKALSKNLASSYIIKPW
ncbi:MAG: response regulator, partial [Eubacteriales bacterium]|nr:response regulator [Eubacteriales bacterium]